MAYIGGHPITYNTGSSIDHQRFIYPSGVTEDATYYSFPVSYLPGNVLVFVKGIAIGADEITAVDGAYVKIKKAEITLNTGDIIECVGHDVNTGSNVKQAISSTSFIQPTTPTRIINIGSMHDSSEVMVFYKGIFLLEGTDFTRSSSTLTLSSSIAIEADDTLDIKVFQPLTSTVKAIQSFIYTQPATPSRTITVTNLTDEDNILVYYNRGLLSEGTDFTRSGTVLTIASTFCVSTGDILEAKLFKGHETYSKHTVTFTTWTKIQGVLTTRTFTPTGLSSSATIMVHYNGVLLKETNDYTVSNGDLILNSGIGVAQNDLLDVKVFTNFVSASGMPATGGPFYNFAVPQYKSTAEHNSNITVPVDEGIMAVGPIAFTGTVTVNSGGYLTVHNQADFQNTLTINGTLKIT